MLQQYPAVELDECRVLILKMIEQAVRDYLSLQYSPAPIERWYYETSECFLFEEEYRVDWGGAEKSLSDFLDILDIDIQWFRETVRKQKDKKDRERLKLRLLYNDEPIEPSNH